MNRSRQSITFSRGNLSKKERKELELLRQQGIKAAAAEDAARVVESEPLPRLGMRFPSGFWSFPVRRPYHRATGMQLAAANPFAAADIHDPTGPVIGIELMSGGGAFTFDPWAMYLKRLISSPNLLIEGSLRQGKSFWIKRLVCLLTGFGHLAINSSDSKGEHGRVAEAIGGDVFKLGSHGSDIRMNPLELPDRHFEETDDAFRSRVHDGRNAVLQQIVTLLNPGERPVTAREAALLDWALTAVVQRTYENPTIRELWRWLDPNNISQADVGYRFKPEDVEDIWYGLRRLVDGDLGGMFDDESSVKLRTDSPYTVFDTSFISQRGEGALAVTQAVTNAWVHNTVSNKTSGHRYFVIREEGWRDMKSVAALEAQQVQLKLSGEFGISMVLIVHEGGDFDSVGPEGSKERELAKSLLRGYANRVCFQQSSSALKRAKEDEMYTDAEAQVIGGLQRGQFLIKMGNRSYVVDGNLTSTEWERELFHTDEQMIA